MEIRPFPNRPDLEKTVEKCRTNVDDLERAFLRAKRAYELARDRSTTQEPKSVKIYTTVAGVKLHKMIKIKDEMSKERHKCEELEGALELVAD